MNYCVHCHMVIFVLSYDHWSYDRYMATIKFVKHHSKLSIYAAFPRFKATLCKIVAFKIHSIEIEDQSHH